MQNAKTITNNLRNIFTILGIFLLVGLSACSNPKNSNSLSDKSAITPVPQATSRAFRFGDPVESEANALIAAESGLRSGFKYVEPLKVVKVEQMSYGEYSKLEGQSNNHPADLKMWFVVYFDQEWQNIPPRPDVKPSPPFRGCVSVAISADDGLLLEVGGPVQTGIIKECDK
jgi:hypothetical protein